ncbi:hypothetical protein BJY59DRAFT_219484 [Rhodotorula toruloides]
MQSALDLLSAAALLDSPAEPPSTLSTAPAAPPPAAEATAAQTATPILASAQEQPHYAGTGGAQELGDIARAVMGFQGVGTVTAGGQGRQRVPSSSGTTGLFAQKAQPSTTQAAVLPPLPSTAVTLPPLSAAPLAAQTAAPSHGHGTRRQAREQRAQEQQQQALKFYTTSTGSAQLAPIAAQAATALPSLPTLPLPTLPPLPGHTMASTLATPPAPRPPPPPYAVPPESGLIRCVCPYTIDDGFTIQCDICNVWQHHKEKAEREAREESQRVMAVERARMVAAQMGDVDAAHEPLATPKQRPRATKPRRSGGSAGPASMQVDEPSTEPGETEPAVETAATPAPADPSSTVIAGGPVPSTPHLTPRDPTPPPHTSASVEPTRSVSVEEDAASPAPGPSAPPKPPVAIGRKRRVAKQPKGRTASSTGDGAQGDDSGTYAGQATEPSDGGLRLSSLRERDRSGRHASMSASAAEDSAASSSEDERPPTASSSRVERLERMDRSERAVEDDRYESWRYEFTPIGSNLFPDATVLQHLDEILSAPPASPLDEIDGATQPVLQRLRERQDATRGTVGGRTGAKVVEALYDLQPAYVSMPSLPPHQPVAVKALSQAATSLSAPPIQSAYIPSPYSSSLHASSAAAQALCPYPRPTTYGLFASAPITAGSFILPYRGEVCDLETYRADPINQYELLGAPKGAVRALPHPWSVVIDARTWGNEARFRERPKTGREAIRLTALSVALDHAVLPRPASSAEQHDVQTSVARTAPRASRHRDLPSRRLCDHRHSETRRDCPVVGLGRRASRPPSSFPPDPAVALAHAFAPPPPRLAPRSSCSSFTVDGPRRGRIARSFVLFARRRLRLRPEARLRALVLARSPPPPPKKGAVKLSKKKRQDSQDSDSPLSDLDDASAGRADRKMQTTPAKKKRKTARFYSSSSSSSSSGEDETRHAQETLKMKQDGGSSASTSTDQIAVGTQADAPESSSLPTANSSRAKPKIEVKVVTKTVTVPIDQVPKNRQASTTKKRPQVDSAGSLGSLKIRKLKDKKTVPRIQDESDGDDAEPASPVVASPTTLNSFVQSLRASEAAEQAGEAVAARRLESDLSIAEGASASNASISPAVKDPTPPPPEPPKPAPAPAPARLSLAAYRQRQMQARVPPPPPPPLASVSIPPPMPSTTAPAANSRNPLAGVSPAQLEALASVLAASSSPASLEATLAPITPSPAAFALSLPSETPPLRPVAALSPPLPPQSSLPMTQRVATAAPSFAESTLPATTAREVAESEAGTPPLPPARDVAPVPDPEPLPAARFSAADILKSIGDYFGTSSGSTNSSKRGTPVAQVTSLAAAPSTRSETREAEEHASEPSLTAARPAPSSTPPIRPQPLPASDAPSSSLQRLPPALISLSGAALGLEAGAAAPVTSSSSAPVSGTSAPAVPSTSSPMPGFRPISAQSSSAASQSSSAFIRPAASAFPKPRLLSTSPATGFGRAPLPPASTARPTSVSPALVGHAPLYAGSGSRPSPPVRPAELDPSIPTAPKAMQAGLTTPAHPSRSGAPATPGTTASAAGTPSRSGWPGSTPAGRGRGGFHGPRNPNMQLSGGHGTPRGRGGGGWGWRGRGGGRGGSAGRGGGAV